VQCNTQQPRSDADIDREIERRRSLNDVVDDSLHFAGRLLEREDVVRADESMLVGCLRPKATLRTARFGSTTDGATRGSCASPASEAKG